MPPTPPPWWHPARHAARRERLLARGAIIRALRAHFDHAGFVEVETPALQVSPGLEAHLHAFATEAYDREGGPRRTLRLATSPEFAMKKLLVAGETSIYQLARAYRNGERGPLHHPEFTMLEWYRVGADYRALMDDCAALLACAADASGAAGFSWRGQTCDPRAVPERLTVAEAFARYTEIDLLAHLGQTDRLVAAARDVGVDARGALRWDDAFFLVFLERIEPRLGVGRPTLLYDYPASMAALARTKPGDSRLAERVELYCCGLELANGFSELTDAIEQRARFVSDMDLKEQLYGERYPIDEDFLTALAHGLPASAGMALGFDRLAMLATGAESIEDVLWSPVAE